MVSRSWVIGNIMGTVISTESNIKENELLVRLSGKESISDNDPFWNKLFSFNFTIDETKRFHFWLWYINLVFLYINLVFLYIDIWFPIILEPIRNSSTMIWKSYWSSSFSMLLQLATLLLWSKSSFDVRQNLIFQSSVTSNSHFR